MPSSESGTTNGRQSKAPMYQGGIIGGEAAVGVFLAQKLGKGVRHINESQLQFNFTDRSS